MNTISMPCFTPSLVFMANSHLRVPSVDTWVQWSWRWDARPGEHTLQVRATDAGGETQPEQRRPVAPDGATGWHTVKVTVG